ncbi:MAG: twin-arginine translocase subunit TatC [Planctomycetota bacterium]
MDQKADQEPFKTMSFGDHLDELRRRIMLAIAGLAAGLVVCLFFGKYIVIFVQQPYQEFIGENAKLQVLSPAEGFMTYIKLSLLCGIIVTSPWIFYQLWQFVAAGLHRHEKKYVYLTVPFSAILFIAGCIFCLWIAVPVTVGFFANFDEKVVDVRSSYTFQNYVSFVIGLTLIFGVAFQTPIAVFFLNRLGIIPLAVLKRSRKYVFLVVLIVSAILTPPGPVILFVLAVPMYLLFEAGVLLCVVFSAGTVKAGPKRL